MSNRNSRISITATQVEKDRFLEAHEKMGYSFQWQTLNALLDIYENKDDLKNDKIISLQQQIEELKDKTIAIDRIINNPVLKNMKEKSSDGILIDGEEVEINEPIEFLDIFLKKIKFK